MGMIAFVIWYEALLSLSRSFMYLSVLESEAEEKIRLLQADLEECQLSKDSEIEELRKLLEESQKSTQTQENSVSNKLISGFHLPCVLLINYRRLTSNWKKACRKPRKKI